MCLQTEVNKKGLWLQSQRKRRESGNVIMLYLPEYTVQRNESELKVHLSF